MTIDNIGGAFIVIGLGKNPCGGLGSLRQFMGPAFYSSICKILFAGVVLSIGTIRINSPSQQLMESQRW